MNQRPAEHTIRYRPRASGPIYDARTERIIGLLDAGNPVTVVVMLRGREVFHPELGQLVLDRVENQTKSSAYSVRQPYTRGARQLTMTLVPYAHPKDPPMPTPARREVARVNLPVSVQCIAALTEALCAEYGDGLLMAADDPTTVIKFVLPEETTT
jgi:hypothetical protein